MAQYDKLVSAYVQDLALSFKVGTVDIVKNRLYKQHTDNTLVVAGDNESCPLFVPLTAEKAGMSVRAVLVGFGAFVVTASGAIAAGAKLSTVATGKVKTAIPGQPIAGLAYNAAADGELVTMLPPVPAATERGASIVASGKADLVAGTVTVANTAILATDVILLTRQVTGGTVGHLRVGTVTPNTSFVIEASVNTDTSTVGWTIVR